MNKSVFIGTIIFAYFMLSLMCLAGDILWKNTGYFRKFNAWDVTADGKYVAIAGNTPTDSIIIWNLDTKMPVNKIIASSINLLKFSHDGKYLAAVSDDNQTIKLYEWQTGYVEWSERTGNSVNIKFSPTDDFLVFLVRNWYPGTHFLEAGLYRLNFKDNQLNCLIDSVDVNDFDISPDGTKTALYCRDQYSYDYKASIINNATCEIIKNYSDLVGGYFMHFDNSGNELLTITRNDSGYVRFIYWDTQSGTITKDLHLNINNPVINISEDNSQIAIFSDYFYNSEYHNKMYILDFNNASITDSFDLNKKLTFFNYNKKNEKIIAGNTYEIFIYNLKTHQIEDYFNEYAGNSHREFINCVRITRDKKYVLSSSDDGFIKVWDSETGAFVRNLYESQLELGIMILSPDGKKVAVHNGPKIDIINIETGNLLLYIQDIIYNDYWDHLINKTVAWSPDGSKIAAVNGYHPLNRYQNVMIYDAETGNILDSLILNKPDKNTDKVYSLNFSPDSRYLITVQMHRFAVWEWDGQKFNLYKDFKSETQCYDGGIYSPDQNYLVYIDGSCSIIDPVTWNTVYNLNAKDTLPGWNLYGYPIYDYIFYNYKPYISATSGQSIKVWDYKKGKLFHIYYDPDYKNHYENFYFSDLSADDKIFVSGDEFGSIIRWKDILTGIVENTEIESQINAYPNPAEDFIDINLPYSGYNTYKMTDILGNERDIKFLSKSDEDLRIDLRGYPPGLYLLEIKDIMSKKAIKIIKK